MNEPTTRDEIETALRAKYEVGELATGLFNTGICWVVMDNVNGELAFQWFDEAVHLDKVLA
ncbi:MAG: hypothetical protein EKK47_13575 [Burkholderiales bacterium]|nr:MAG: hypothetical protein EKK47_13575 [Burkholderiales bacterium]